MRKLMLAAAVLLAATAGTATTASAQTPDSTKKEPAAAPSLEGQWTGSISTPNGAMNVLAAIKKNADGYTGTISGMEGDVPLREIKIVGDTVTAVATMSAQGTSIEVWYSFLFKDGALDGRVDANVQGQSMTFPLYLKKSP